MGRGGNGWRRASTTSYEITFTYRGQRCRERIKLKPSPANDRAVERHRHAVLDAIARGTFDYAVTFPDSPRALEFADRPGQVVTVKEHLDRWLKQQKDQVSASTWNGYRKTINNQLIPQFGDLKLIELKRPVIRDWCAGLDVSNKRIANMLSPLRLALQEAVDDELIETNPLYGWSYRRKEAPKPKDDVDPFSVEEQTAILAAAPAGHARNLIQFALWAGLRTSELVALEWGDVDWQKDVVRVSRAITQDAKGVPEVTKTISGNRDVKLLAPAIEALRAQKALSLLHPSGRIFLNPRTAEPWTGDQPIRKTLWQPILKRAKVRYRRPYQTRHTYASMMLSAGEPPRWVAEQMGHSDLHMLFRVYGRWMPDANPDAGCRAVKAFSHPEARNSGETHG